MATTLSAHPAPSVESLAHGLTRLLDDLHEQLAGEQLRTLERLRIEPADLLALGTVGAAPGSGADPEALARLQRRGLVEAGRPGAFRPTPEGRALLDGLHDARSRAIRRFVESLDRSRRLRLSGALHLLSDALDGEAVVG